MNDTVVLYHADCIDGFTAAYCFWKKYGDRADYIPVKYGEPIPHIRGKRTIFIVDFSYSRKILLELYNRATKLIVLDHHKTAEEELKGLDFCTFDMNKSGARLAWEYLHLVEDCPIAIKWIEDYDLWRFKYVETKAFHAALTSYIFDFVIWDSIFKYPKDILLAGDAILRYQAKLVDILAKQAELLPFQGFRNIPWVKCSLPQLTSDLGNRLCKGKPFSVVEMPDQISLRSDEQGEDVSVIAKKLGGGGHVHAAGYPI